MKPSAILTSDWHIRATTPLCRTDDFLSAMWSKVEFILELAQKYDCPIINAGDIGENALWPNWLLAKFLKIVNSFEVELCVIAGQHDLPNHNIDDLDKSALAVLYENPSIFFWEENHYHRAFHFGQNIEPIERESHIKTIAVTHQMIIKDNPLWPGQIANTGKEILKKYPEYDLIVSGDNHHTFTEEVDARLLVNPGSLTRHKADQVDHKPCVFLWYAETNEIEQVFIPIEQGVIDRTYIDNKSIEEIKDMAFVERMNSNYDLDLSYEENMERHLKSNRVHSEVEKKIWEAINGNN